jgi:hypothetical protein
VGLWFQTCAASRSARADGCVAVATGSLALGAGNLLLWSAFGSCIRVRSGHCRSPRLASAHFPTFIATNATRAIPAITNMTPALKIAPIASHPDVSALTTTVARTGRTRRAEIEVLIRPWQTLETRGGRVAETATRHCPWWPQTSKTSDLAFATRKPVTRTSRRRAGVTHPVFGDASCASRLGVGTWFYVTAADVRMIRGAHTVE